MKMLKTVLATAALTAAATSAQAATQTVLSLSGYLEGMNVKGATVDPTLTPRVRAYTDPNNSTAESGAAILSGVKPSFSQLGNFTLTTTGTFGQSDFAYTGIEGAIDFNKYETYIVVSGFGNATVTQGNSVYKIGGAGNGTVTWDAATRTLTLGQYIKYSNVDGDLGTYSPGTGPASDAQGVWATDLGAKDGLCTGNATICGGQKSQFIPKPNWERLYLTLTFAENMVDFTGQVTTVDIGGAVTGGQSGNQWQQLSFSGQVPVPAAAWLFGSALVGLAGVARRKAA